jgi:hypothetical protein
MQAKGHAIITQTSAAAADAAAAALSASPPGNVTVSLNLYSTLSCETHHSKTAGQNQSG